MPIPARVETLHSVEMKAVEGSKPSQQEAPVRREEDRFEISRHMARLEATFSSTNERLPFKSSLSKTVHVNLNPWH
jgi:hypothetical protein